MGRRRRSRRSPGSGGMFGSLRKKVKTIGGAAVGLAGLFIAASPAISGVNAATNNGQNLNQASLTSIPAYVAGAYGVNSQGSVDFGKLIPTVVFPIAGAYIFIKGLRMILRSV